MLKDFTFYYLTIIYNKRVTLILAARFKIAIFYSQCKRVGLKYIIKLITKYYAYYIYVKTKCSLVFSNIKRNKITKAQKAKELQLLRVKAKAFYPKLKITKLKKKKKKVSLKKLLLLETKNVQKIKLKC